MTSPLPSAPSPEEARPIEPDRLRAFVESVARCDCERGYQHGGWAADSCLGLEADVRQNPGRYGDPLKTQLLTGVNRCRTCEAKLVLTASVDSRVVSPSAGARMSEALTGAREILGDIATWRVTTVGEARRHYDCLVPVDRLAKVLEAIKAALASTDTESRP